MGKIEEELKQLGTRYSEKKQALLQHQRKKGYCSLAVQCVSRPTNRSLLLLLVLL